ncbi:hypothetical protein C0993_001821, partial [Termitomyces sp. T159_Od127]
AQSSRRARACSTAGARRPTRARGSGRRALRHRTAASGGSPVRAGLLMGMCGRRRALVWGWMWRLRGLRRCSGRRRRGVWRMCWSMRDMLIRRGIPLQSCMGCRVMRR